MKENIRNINENKIHSFIEKSRPPVEVRNKLDLGYLYKTSEIILFEIRPMWTNPTEKQNLPFGKIKYVRTRQFWKLYWMRASGKWEAYKPFPESTNLDDILSAIDKDVHGCFKG